MKNLIKAFKKKERGGFPKGVTRSRGCQKITKINVLKKGHQERGNQKPKKEGGLPRYAPDTYIECA